MPAEVQSELYDIRLLCANHAAFAALRQDGQVGGLMVWSGRWEVMFEMYVLYIPGTPNNRLKMDVW